MAQRQPAQELNVLLSARGLQDCDVQAHHPHTDSAVVAVRIGGALMYFHDWASAATVSRGWARCSREATWLPAQSRGSTRPQQVVEPVSAVSVIDVVGGAAVPVAGRLEAIEGRPKRLFVSVGRLAIIVHDRAAYGSLRTAFATAREMAAAVFPGRPTDLHTVAGEIAARAMGSQRPSGRPATPSGRGPHRPCAPADPQPPLRTEPVMTQPDYPLPVLASYELYQVAHIATFVADRLARLRGASTKAERGAAVARGGRGPGRVGACAGRYPSGHVAGADRRPDVRVGAGPGRGRAAVGGGGVVGAVGAAGVGGDRARARPGPGRRPHGRSRHG